MRQNIADFAHAALPWISIGLLLAIFFARSAVKKNKGDTPDYGTEGMCLGMCFGSAIGVATDNVGIGMVLGMALGLLLGTQKNKNQESGTEEAEK